MGTGKIIQGRCVTGQDIALIRCLLTENPAWGRRRLSIELCARWDWRNGAGQIKDMACRTLLLKLERAGEIRLPPRRGGRDNKQGYRHPVELTHDRSPMESDLRALQPVRIEPLKTGDVRLPLFKFFLHRYHYLSHRTCVGENLKYLVHDRLGRPIACLLFGAAAWKTKSRDAFIGWDAAVRERNLSLIANNTRFLILPWVRVPHLASHVLAQVRARLAADWIAKYGHPIHLLETFVERDRFKGTCYRAAGWLHVGATTGRSRNDSDFMLAVPVKEVYLQPLTADFRRRLCA
jgi:hypothetical protein